MLLAARAATRPAGARSCTHLVAGLTPAQLELRDSVRAFVRKEVAPLAESTDKTNEFPMQLWPLMGEMGILGPTVEEEYGGLGLGYVEHALICEEMSRASSSIGLSYGAHSNLCVNQIRLNGTEEQKQKYLPGLIAGTQVGALSMTEAGAGSDVVSMTMHARKTSEGDFVLNGSKHYCTNAPDADTLVVYGKTDPQAGPRGITAFVIERGMEGFSTGPKLDKLGHRGSNTGELFFEDCVVPAANVLGGEGQGVRVLMSGLDYERCVLSGGAVGLMQGVLDVVLPYVHERKQFGQPIGTFQLMQGKLADMYTKLQTARAFQYSVARCLDNPSIDKRSMRKDVAALILLAGESACEVANDGVQMLGGNGYTNDYAVGRMMRDAKLFTIGGGTSEVRRMLIGRELFEETS